MPRDIALSPLLAVDILEQRGASDYIGEPVTQIQHMTQCGYFAYMAMLEKPNDYPLETVLSAALHDLGHLLNSSDFSPAVKLEDMIDPETSCNLGRRSHEHVGAAFLRLTGYPYPIPDLVESHVDAKRYRVAKDKAYADKLSEASKRTLLLQGGMMNLEECLRFEANPLCHDRLLLRQCDEKSKETTLSYGPVDIKAYWERKEPLPYVPDLNSYRQLIKELLCK